MKEKNLFMKVIISEWRNGEFNREGMENSYYNENYYNYLKSKCQFINGKRNGKGK